MLSSDMSGSPYDAVGTGAIMDVNSHPEMDIPAPGYSPPMQHSTKMAGDVIPFPVTMEGSDNQRIRSMQGIDSGRIKPRPAKVLMGPGANK